MAKHPNIASMQSEALQEMIEVAQYCVEFDKSKDPRWGGNLGCYGYPGASLLLSIVDTVGAIIEGGGNNVSKHFQVLNNKNWYNLSLSQDEIKLMEKAYRNTLSHNSHIRSDVAMDIGSTSNRIIELNDNGKTTLYLIPFLERSKEIVKLLVNHR